MRLPARGRVWALASALSIVAVVGPAAQTQRPVFNPPLTTPESLAPFLSHVEAGSDVFTHERDAADLEARLASVGAWLRDGATEAAEPRAMLAPGFRGSRLWDRPQPSPRGGLAIARGGTDAAGAGAPASDARGILDDLRQLGAYLGPIAVAEFMVTGVEAAATDDMRTEARAELVGVGGDGARASYVATWRMRWRRDAGAWRVVEWTAGPWVVARAATPLFREVTREALGAADQVTRQFDVPLDAWMARIDSVLTRDSNGHHGVSVGDADGDGRDDLYVAQPSGLPNRLLRARGDGTFEDATEASGLGLLDDTAQSLFADVDNDGDQDLVLATSLQPLLLINDGRGHFAVREHAFAFAAPLQGLLTGVTMADFDRDGYLDAYLCVYSYFFGAGEDKAGTPMPYHDARNGPPGVLFRNDGRGTFVDVTADAGLSAGNDRYHFAASWGDYDEDGWPDLFVANDFGTKNLYRNLGRQASGGVRFEDVAASAGALDHGAGMSAAFVDYDNDGRLDLYAGNMWSAAGQRVTASPAFMPEASETVRAHYRHHAGGNTLLRNRGDGTFDDVSAAAGVTMGRWAWASDAIDVDGDGWQDLYVANGMLSRDDGRPDLDGYFWRQVVARSPLTRVTGTPYDDAWRAINQLLVHGSIASRQRNVLLRNDGKGRFDDISGAAGLDLDQDGRSFAVLDLEGDGDPDLAVMAARQAPQLRLFRNERAHRAAIAVRLTGTTSNRDAIGARVRVDTDRVAGTRVVQAGSGFLSQHARELTFGLGDSTVVRRLEVRWPSGVEQVFTDVPVGMRYRLVEGGELEREPLAAAARSTSSWPGGPPRARPSAAEPPEATWFYAPFPAPAFAATGIDGRTYALDALKGHPAIVTLWRSDVSDARDVLRVLAEGRERLAQAHIGWIAIALDEPAQADRVRAASPAAAPVVHATKAQGLLWAIVHRHLFMNRQPVPLPTTLLLDAEGRVVRSYHGPVEPARVVADAEALDVPDSVRLARALPFPGVFHVAIPARNFLPYGRELLDEGLETEAIAALERATAANPTPPVLYRLGTLLARSGQTTQARAAFERALAIDPSLAEAHNDVGTIVAREGDLDGAIARFRQALAATPDYPDALNNLGYALLLSGREAEARPLYERALALQPDFPEALNNLGLLLGRSGALDDAERYFRDALARRPDFGDAANNLALVLVARDRSSEAIALLEDLLGRQPSFENAYVTLARIHLSAGRTTEGLRAVERLLQRNPTHPIGLALAREYRPR